MRNKFLFCIIGLIFALFIAFGYLFISNKYCELAAVRILALIGAGFGFSAALYQCPMFKNKINKSKVLKKKALRH